MSEIVLVTQNDEPALAFGEYEISADGNTLYVGSAGVSDGSSEVIYRGISPAQIKSGVLSRIKTFKGNMTAEYNASTIRNGFTIEQNTIEKNIVVKTNDVNLILSKED